MAKRMWKWLVPAVIVAGSLVLWMVPGSQADSPPEGSKARSRPNIEQPIRQLEEVLASLEQQQPRNYTITNISFLYDALLYIEVNERERLLSGSALEEERAGQRRWAARRAEVVQAAAREYEGGSLAPFVAAEAAIKLTKERLAELQKSRPSR